MYSASPTTPNRSFQSQVSHLGHGKCLSNTEILHSEQNQSPFRRSEKQITLCHCLQTRGGVSSEGEISSPQQFLQISEAAICLVSQFLQYQSPGRGLSKKKSIPFSNIRFQFKLLTR